MGKTTGLGNYLYVGGVNLSGDTNSFNGGGGLAGTFDTTGIDKLAPERIGLLRDGRLSWVSFFNPSAGQAHGVLSALPTADLAAMLSFTQALGAPAFCLIGKQSNYDPTRGADGSLTLAVDLLADSFGGEWGTMHTTAASPPGLRTDTVATNGAAVDSGAASTTFGLQAYLQVFSFTGTSVTIKLQESSDNAVGDAYADVVGGAFTAVTAAPTTQRIATAAALTVERWLRVVTTGTFSSATFAVAVVRNQTATAF